MEKSRCLKCGKGNIDICVEKIKGEVYELCGLCNVDEKRNSLHYSTVGVPFYSNINLPIKMSSFLK